MMLQQNTTRQLAAALLLSSLAAAASCGRKEGGGGGGGPAPAADAASDATVPETEPASASSAPQKAQLGDETVGIKNGPQLLAHYSLVTGIRYDALPTQDKDRIQTYLRSLPADNSAEKFNSSHVLAATKLATDFCRRLVEREATPPADYQRLLPEMDWNSGKMTAPFARALYPTFIALFWGVDTANQPAAAALTPILDSLTEALNKPVKAADGTDQNVNARGIATALCIVVASSFPALEL